jgi:hypothetical protein
MPFGHGACLCVGVNQRATSLGEALQVVGDMSRLAALLGVRKEKLCGWLCGEEQPPLEVFLSALDLIADGPYVDSRRIRVAALRD